eukprot:6475571-Amphidinium_carterae.2
MHYVALRVYGQLSLQLGSRPAAFSAGIAHLYGMPQYSALYLTNSEPQSCIDSSQQIPNRAEQRAIQHELLVIEA